jgi:hypothetical protein
MSKELTPAWLSGAETMDHLKAVYPASTETELGRALQSAVKDGRVEIRFRGLTDDESIYDNRGLLGNVGGDWIGRFVDSDPESKRWKESFGRVEFCSEHVRKQFGSKSRAKVSEPKRVSPKGIVTFVTEYIASERSAGRRPIQTALWEKAKQELPGATRKPLLAEHTKQMRALGLAVRPGRTRKSPQ